VNAVSAGPCQPLVNASILSSWIYSSANTSTYQQVAELATYRYQNAAYFTYVPSIWWLGAYHASQLPYKLVPYRRNRAAFEKKLGGVI